MTKKVNEDVEVEGTIYANDIQFRRGKQGQILYRDKDEWRKLDPGQPGQFLRTQGSGANPMWATISIPGEQFLGNIRCQAGNYMGTGFPVTIYINDARCDQILYIRVLKKVQGEDSARGLICEKIRGKFFTPLMRADSDGGQVYLYTNIEYITVNESGKNFTCDNWLTDSGHVYYYIVFYRVSPA